MTVDALAQSSGEEREPTTPEKQVIKDLYLSFKFSQGNFAYQEWLFGILARYYAFTWSDAAKTSVRANIETIFDQTLPRLHAPKRHAKEMDGVPIFDNEGEEVRIFQKIGSSFKTTLMRWLEPKVGLTQEPQTQFDSISLRTAGKHLIDRDLRYVEAGSRSLDTDPHASYFRQYVLMHEPTDSEAFDAVFRAMSDPIVLDNIANFSNGRVVLDSLSYAWETAHPGQSFYPQAA